MTAPTDDTQAPERLDLYFTRGRPMMKPAENGRYVRSADYDALASLPEAREAAAALAMREAALEAIHARKVVYQTIQERHDVCDPNCLNEWEEMGHTAEAHDYAYDAIRALPLIDTAALDRLIAARVREAVEAEREACARKVETHPMRFAGQTEDVIRDGLSAAIRARARKEGQS